jgi:hypothetical protein
MAAGKRRVPGGAAVRAMALAALAMTAAGCGSAASSPVTGQAPPPLAPAMTPTAVPGLGRLALGTFPATDGGRHALQLCEDWAGLRGQYAARVEAGATPFQMEQWFSSAAWQAPFKANSPLQDNPGYGAISTAFGMATIGQSASVAAARRLDAACAAAS